jgi:hypothetical protein
MTAKLKVFISYSRRDSSAFAENLLAGLDLVGFEPFLDKRDIAAGEDWESRLAALILAADTVVFVVSPESVRSERCAWEIDKAVALGKRLIPVVASAVAEAETPASLKRLNYIFFTDPLTFSTSLGDLARALRTDLDWIREHTRLGELVTRWDARARPEALLLRGAELEAAQAWLAAWTPGAPEPTDLQRTLVAASLEAETERESERRRQLDDMAKAQVAQARALAEREAAVKQLSRRTSLGLIAAGTLTATAGGFAYWGVDAENRFRNQRARADIAAQQAIEEAIRKESERTDIEGQLSAFATSGGKLADDGAPGENSPYTKAVLAELADRNVSLQSALARARLNVLRTSRTSQTPFLSTDLNGDIYLQRQSASRRRLAIVVSVNKFIVSESPDKIAAGELDNVERDAIAWEGFLRERAGFEVIRLKNPDLAACRDVLSAAAQTLSRKQSGMRSLLHPAAIAVPPANAPPADTLAFFFYSGVGASVRGSEYLATDDADVGNMQSGKSDGLLSLDEVQTTLRRAAAASVLILDTNFGNRASINIR